MGLTRRLMFPASHGCMRAAIIDAISAFGWLIYGDVVDGCYWWPSRTLASACLGALREHALVIGAHRAEHDR
jgi:hypothetical protein